MKRWSHIRYHTALERLVGPCAVSFATGAISEQLWYHSQDNDAALFIIGCVVSASLTSWAAYSGGRNAARWSRHKEANHERARLEQKIGAVAGGALALGAQAAGFALAYLSTYQAK